MKARLTTLAKKLRHDATDAERLLWRHVRAYRLDGRKFKRQEAIGSHIADFVCYEAKLVVELDGGQHLESGKDGERDRWFTQQGFRVLRFWNNDVLTNIEGVLETIASELSPSPRPWRADTLPVKPAVCGERASAPPPAPDRSANAVSAGPIEGEGVMRRGKRNPLSPGGRGSKGV
jgi:very-short-patch-repair endonuclease